MPAPPHQIGNSQPTKWHGPAGFGNARRSVHGARKQIRLDHGKIRRVGNAIAREISGRPTGRLPLVIIPQIEVLSVDELVPIRITRQRSIGSGLRRIRAVLENEPKA